MQYPRLTFFLSYCLMTLRHDPRVAGLLRLVSGATRPPAGATRIALALTLGVLCHFVFAAGVLAMIAAMYFGMSESLGAVPWPWAALANGALVLQFPLVHSLLLTARGSRLVGRLVPGPYGRDLVTTTYATIAALQLLALFALWTPSGIVWWRAQGAALWILTLLYAGSWLLLLKASFDAGAEVQSGALGWMSVLGGPKPAYPDMPERGLFAVIRQPIYLSFALTLWTTPVWTPDQLALTVPLTAYCLFAPRHKERRLLAPHGARFARYRAATPYMIPHSRPRPAGQRRPAGS
jgi:protein-S-isoprenylcysteine O-methyltransferase Ste14